MEEMGCTLPEKRMILSENSLKGGYECGQRLKQSELSADCFFCASDSIALGFMAAFADTGLIPDQVGILAVGNSDAQYSKYHAPSLSVINIPIEEMAEGCCQYLHENMYSLNAGVEIKYFETKLYERETTQKSKS